MTYKAIVLVEVFKMSRKVRKVFGCSHKGFRKFYHYCDQIKNGIKLQKKGGEYESNNS